ncbi:MAG: hypothetical protein JWR26_2563 [Pedosphaera sp.]|nr:hypothetical protein [Pedosphaera sp.]
MSNPPLYNGGMKGALYECGMIGEPALAEKQRQVARVPLRKTKRCAGHGSPGGVHLAGGEPGEPSRSDHRPRVRDRFTQMGLRTATVQAVGFPRVFAHSHYYGRGRRLCESGVWFFAGIGRGQVAATETVAVRLQPAVALQDFQGRCWQSGRRGIWVESDHAFVPLSIGLERLGTAWIGFFGAYIYIVGVWTRTDTDGEDARFASAFALCELWRTSAPAALEFGLDRVWLPKPCKSGAHRGRSLREKQFLPTHLWMAGARVLADCHRGDEQSRVRAISSESGMAVLPPQAGPRSADNPSDAAACRRLPPDISSVFFCVCTRPLLWERGNLDRMSGFTGWEHSSQGGLTTDPACGTGITKSTEK